MAVPRWRANQFATIVVTGEWRRAGASEAAQWVAPVQSPARGRCAGARGVFDITDCYLSPVLQYANNPA